MGPVPKVSHDALKGAFLKYIDSSITDAEIFELGGTYKVATRNSPCDIKGLVKLSSLIVELLRVAPEGRLLKSQVKSHVREAILERPRRIIMTGEPLDDLASRISRQVLRVCFIFCRMGRRLTA